MNIKAAIFDMDGTLLDSMYVWNSIGSDYLLERGITPHEDINKKFLKLSLLQAAEYYISEYGITDSIEKIVTDINHSVENKYMTEVKPRTGIMTTLENFKNRGVKMCVATATDRYMVEAALKRNNMLDFFECILTCTEEGCDKNVPDIYEKGSRILGAANNSEAMVFEDAPHAVVTAKKAGFIVGGIFDKSYKDFQKEIMEYSDFYLQSFDEWNKIYKTL